MIVFTRYPEPGLTKTRLIPVLGAHGAALLHRRMTEHTLTRVRDVCRRENITLEARYDGGSEALMRAWLGIDLLYRAQNDGDLGARMARSFEEAFIDGADRVVLIGTDIPRISEEIIHQAFCRLQQDDLVFGPTEDGGYYLIGMRREAFPGMKPELFSDISWGGETVLAETLQRAKHGTIRFFLLQKLADVDRSEDLHRCTHMRKRGQENDASKEISIVIPVRNEAEHIGRTLAAIEMDHVREIIVADGGSLDQTKAIAEALGACVVETRPPKAGQMNHGAAEAKGRVLLFLHADTRLPPGFAAPLLKAVDRPGFIAGAFSLKIDAHRITLRIIETFANWRSRYFQFPYGDQAIFMSRDKFQSVGGFPDLPIMEDFELIRRLKKLGAIVTLDAPVYTSSRRWDNFGTIKTFFVNQMVVTAYLAGVSPRRIAGFYRRGEGLR